MTITLNNFSTWFCAVCVIIVIAGLLTIGVSLIINNTRTKEKEKEGMITVAKLRRDQSKLDSIHGRYLKDGAFFSFIANGEMKHFLTFGGNTRTVLEGIALMIATLCARSGGAINEEAIDEIAKVAKAEYRNQLGIEQKEE